MAGHVRCRIRRNDRRSSRAERSKGLVGAVSGACTISGYNAEMIRGARAQGADAGSHILVCVASLTLRRTAESVAGCCTVLEINTRAQPMGIERAIESG